MAETLTSHKRYYYLPYHPPPKSDKFQLSENGENFCFWLCNQAAFGKNKNGENLNAWDYAATLCFVKIKIVKFQNFNKN